MARVTETELVEALRDLVTSVGVDEVSGLSPKMEAALDDCRTFTFDERGVLTNNEGLVLRLADGSEFQITVVRSR